MNCQNCQQALEPGAAFCGNCGQPLQVQSQPLQPAMSGTLPTSQPAPTPAIGVPSYAQVKPGQHGGETKALLALLFGIFGIIASLIPIIGLPFSITGIVMATLSRQSKKKTMSTIGLVLSIVGLVLSLVIWAWTAAHYEELTGRSL